MQEPKVLTVIERQNIRRKFSFPAILHSSSLLDVSSSTTARRRMSNVSDVVSRKLSYTIGWKATQIPTRDIVSQLGDELERMHPRIYSGIARQVSPSPDGDFSSGETVVFFFSAVARELFRMEITWGKIISLFAVAGGLAIDCVRHGHPDYLPTLVQGISDVIEDELVPWINEKGGWIGLNSYVRPATPELNPLEWTVLLIGLTFVLFLTTLIFRLITSYLLPLAYSKNST